MSNRFNEGDRVTFISGMYKDRSGVISYATIYNDDCYDVDIDSDANVPAYGYELIGEDTNMTDTKAIARELRNKAEYLAENGFEVTADELTHFANLLDPKPPINVVSVPGKLVINYTDPDFPVALGHLIHSFTNPYSSPLHPRYGLLEELRAVYTHREKNGGK